jgi:predicted DsbA family dithiol-disulfide isomerase
LQVVTTHFPLHPETPEEGKTLEELFAGRGVNVAAMNRRMKALMEKEGLPYGERSSTFNSRMAQELAKWSESQPKRDRVHSALFKAYFVEGKNIGNADFLVEIAEKVGLDAAEARQVLETRRFRDAVDADWRRSWELGITGVPTYIIGGFKLTGAQPYEELERFFLTARQALS